MSQVISTALRSLSELSIGAQSHLVRASERLLDGREISADRLVDVSPHFPAGEVPGAVEGLRRITESVASPGQARLFFMEGVCLSTGVGLSIEGPRPFRKNYYYPDWVKPEDHIFRRGYESWYGWISSMPHKESITLGADGLMDFAEILAFAVGRLDDSKTEDHSYFRSLVKLLPRLKGVASETFISKFTECLMRYRLSSDHFSAIFYELIGDFEHKPTYDLIFILPLLLRIACHPNFTIGTSSWPISLKYEEWMKLLGMGGSIVHTTEPFRNKSFYQLLISQILPRFESGEGPILIHQTADSDGVESSTLYKMLKGKNVHLYSSTLARDLFFAEIEGVPIVFDSKGKKLSKLGLGYEGYRGLSVDLSLAEMAKLATSGRPTPVLVLRHPLVSPEFYRILRSDPTHVFSGEADIMDSESLLQVSGGEKCHIVTCFNLFTSGRFKPEALRAGLISLGKTLVEGGYLLAGRMFGAPGDPAEYGGVVIYRREGNSLLRIRDIKTDLPVPLEYVDMRLRWDD